MKKSTVKSFALASFAQVKKRVIHFRAKLENEPHSSLYASEASIKNLKARIAKKSMVFVFFCLFTLSVSTAQQTSVTASLTAVIANDSTNYKDYCGLYKMLQNPYIDEVKIELKDGKLISRTPEDEEIVFEHTEKDAFFIPPFNATAIFTRENGVVNGVKVTVQGKEMVGEKHIEKKP